MNLTARQREQARTRIRAITLKHNNHKLHKRIAIFAGLMLALFIMIFMSMGCSFSVMNKGLTELNNQHISKVFDAIGYPSAKQEMPDGNTVYIWNTSHLYTSYGQSHSSEAHCEVKVIATNDIVTNWEYFGNNAGCWRYASRLRKILN